MPCDVSTIQAVRAARWRISDAVLVLAQRGIFMNMTLALSAPRFTHLWAAVQCGTVSGA